MDKKVLVATGTHQAKLATYIGFCTVLNRSTADLVLLQQMAYSYNKKKKSSVSYCLIFLPAASIRGTGQTKVVLLMFASKDVK